MHADAQQVLKEFSVFWGCNCPGFSCCVLDVLILELFGQFIDPFEHPAFAIPLAAHPINHEDIKATRFINHADRFEKPRRPERLFNLDFFHLLSPSIFSLFQHDFEHFKGEAKALFSWFFGIFRDRAWIIRIDDRNTFGRKIPCRFESRHTLSGSSKASQSQFDPGSIFHCTTKFHCSLLFRFSHEKEARNAPDLYDSSTYAGKRAGIVFVSPQRRPSPVLLGAP